MIEITQDYKTDLFAVQEVSWLGRSIIERDCRIPYSVRMKKIFLEQI